MFVQGFLASAAAAPAQGVVPAPASAEKVDAFRQAMTRQAGVEPQVAETISPPVSPQAADGSARVRAREGLDLNGPAPVGADPSAGDMILRGVERMRGVFQAREANIAELMKGKTTDAGTLMAMQMEVTNFTLLVDISSKLTGKATQSMDTLMKGQ